MVHNHDEHARCSVVITVFLLSHCEWLYFCFCLRYRDNEEMMLVRGLCVMYEAIRQWCRKVGQTSANELRRRRPRPSNRRPGCTGIYAQASTKSCLYKTA